VEWYEAHQLDQPVGINSLCWRKWAWLISWLLRRNVLPWQRPGWLPGCQLPWTNTFDDSITLSTESVCSGDDHVGLITLITSCLRSRQSIVIHFYSVICPSPASESEAHHDGKLETRLSVYTRCGQCQRVQFSNHDWKYWIEQLSRTTDRYVTVSYRLKKHWRWMSLADNESAIRGTDSNSLSADRLIDWAMSMA